MIEVLSNEEKEKLLVEYELKFLKLCTLHSKDTQEVRTMSRSCLSSYTIEVKLPLNEIEFVEILKQLVNLNYPISLIRNGLGLLSKEKYQLVKRTILMIEPKLYFLFKTKDSFKLW